MLKRRASLEVAEWKTASIAAQERLIGLPFFSRAKCIALYSPVKNEIGTELLFNKARYFGKKVVYPAVSGNDLIFIEVSDLDTLIPGPFGILEPDLKNSSYVKAKADIIVVPGVAFDLNGQRIGFGKGYYDRYLWTLPADHFFVGLCHDFQVLNSIPSDKSDVRMHSIVTDQRLIITGGQEAGTGIKPD